MSGAAPFDRGALEVLYARLERPMYSALYRSTWDAEEAQDLVQEAFVRLWAIRDRVRPATVEPLVWRIATNLARKRRRWSRLRAFFGLDERRADPGDGPDAGLLGAERAASVRAAIEALPERDREVVLLTHFSELSTREVAEVLGIPEGTVGSRRNRAMAALRATLTALDKPGDHARTEVGVG